ncbi:hypothetical protein AYO22_11213 [Fonsecaea multimorphosa]|nr:hypothetical protein AYO22_11213 [Fonsecaea multimorphosa]
MACSSTATHIALGLATLLLTRFLVWCEGLATVSILAYITCDIRLFPTTTSLLTVVFLALGVFGFTTTSPLKVVCLSLGFVGFTTASLLAVVIFNLNLYSIIAAFGLTTTFELGLLDFTTATYLAVVFPQLSLFSVTATALNAMVFFWLTLLDFTAGFLPTAASDFKAFFAITTAGICIKLQVVNLGIVTVVGLLSAAGFFSTVIIFARLRGMVGRLLLAHESCRNLDTQV